MTKFVFSMKLNSVEDVKKFCEATCSHEADIDVKSGKYIVDGKSIMGMLSLALDHELECTVYAPERSQSVSCLHTETKEFWTNPGHEIEVDA